MTEGPPEHLGELPNQVLRQRVVAVCRAIRALNEQWRQETLNILDQFWPSAEGESDSRTDAIVKHWTKTTEQFNAQIRTAAVALQREMLKRLDEEREAAEERQAALDHGILTGPDPLGDAARELERIAGRLPE